MNNTLTHHGIKGQKWGIRRFQKKDGSLTPAGKKRYASELDDKKKAYDTAKSTRTTALSNKILARGHYDDAFNRAQKYTKSHQISRHVVKGQKRTNDLLWKDAKDKLTEYQNAKLDSKKANKDLKIAKRDYKNAKTNAKYEKYDLDPTNSAHIIDVYAHGYRGAQRIRNRMKNKNMSYFKSSMIETGRQVATSALLTIGTISAMGLAAKYSNPTSQVLDSTGKVLKSFYD